MRVRVLTTIFLFLILALTSVDTYAQPNNQLRQVIEQGRAAYLKDDFTTSLELFQTADRLRPDHPMIARMLIRLYALTNQKASAYRALQQLLLIDADVDFLLHKDLESIHGDEEFKAVQQAFESMNQSKGTFDTLAIIKERKLHPESLVILPNDGGVLLGSVHQKRIVKVHPSGELEDWVISGAHGLYAVMGMKVDYSRKILWVASTAIPQMTWFDNELRGKAAVFAFDLESKVLIKKFEPNSTDEFWFGDLALDDDGAVYISNSQTPEIYRISSSEDELILWKRFPELVSLQGLTVTESRLYFADYLNGIYTLPLDSDNPPTKMSHPDNTTLKGIDGLYNANGRLITIQNGVYPNRISGWTISEDGLSLTGSEIIDHANPLFGEPTLGDIKDGYFYYIANSQWTGYKTDGSILDEEKLQDIYLLKAPLQP